ncbi:hypothetical protein NEAUS05_2455 [Nematocida ausubeli]|nr:hypothetical protein NEAUS05_2455 [Nematocida ausubeli]
MPRIIMKSEKLNRLKRKSFFDLQKMIGRLLLNLIMVQTILTRINMEDIKTVHETLVGKKQDVVINPRGSLNLLRGYIGNQNGYMYNKRFYSPEIDTDYTLSKKGLSSKNKQEYNFTRKPVNDRVYKDIATQTPNGEYLSSYHAQLIKMFPSVDRDLSIEAGRSNALTNFLRADHVKKDTKYILAALLLLSEGVDLKISIDRTGKKNNLVIKSKTCKEKVFLDVEMHMEGTDPVTKKYKEDIYQSEAAGVVKFYMQCRDNPLLKKGGKFAMPSTREEFESGLFLNNAAFLIQTYIYEFIDTAESYKDFVNAVHELMVDQVAEKENPEQTKKKGKKGRIFNELFIAKDTLSENIKYIESFCDLVKYTNENADFPFCNSSQLPQFTRVPRCKLDKSGFERNQFLYYSDCVETALLGLFCCLAYNPETGKYETDHMGTEVSKELRDFFEKYPKPKETTNFEMHKEWSRVVACLEDEKIDYWKSKNELIAGIANIFLVIAEITGQKADILELVECIENACKYKELDSKQSEIADKIESIIKALSLNKNVRVECKQMRLGKRSNGKADIFSEIRVISGFGKVYNGISLDIIPKHAVLTFLRSLKNKSAQVKEKYEEVKNTYSGVDCYIGYIAYQYVSVELDSLNNSREGLSKNLRKTIESVIQEESKGISRIFLLEKLSSNGIKRYIINSFMLDTVDKEVGQTNPLTRFTANILGSVPLNDLNTRSIVLESFPFHTSWQEYYPRLGFKPSEFIPKEDDFWNQLEPVDVYRTLLDDIPESAALKATCNYLRVTANDARMNNSRVAYITRDALLDLIVSKGMIEDLLKIQSIIKESMEDCDLNYVYITWFIHVCSGVDGPLLESIKTIYDSIAFHSHSELFMRKKEISGPLEYFEKGLSVLKENKYLFCSKNDKKSMKKYDTLVSYLFRSCWRLNEKNCTRCSIS